MSEITKDENVMDAKFKRLVIALTVGAVVLISVLIVLMCYQLIKIGVENRKNSDLKAEIARIEEQFENDGEELEFRRTTLYIERVARELGYHYAEDIDG